MADDRSAGGAPTGGQTTAKPASDQGRQGAPIDIRLLAEKVYALFLAEARREQAQGIRRAPRGRG